MISFRQFAKLKFLTFGCHGKKEKKNSRNSTSFHTGVATDVLFALI